MHDVRQRRGLNLANLVYIDITSPHYHLWTCERNVLDIVSLLRGVMRAMQIDFRRGTRNTGEDTLVRFEDLCASLT